jgi:cobalamin biosynthesis protein CbiG
MGESKGGQAVSNHFPDATKMVSDTPRTDMMEQHAPVGIRRNSAFEQASDFSRQLERELNVANERIKRLEEVGDEVVINYVNSLSAFEMWRKAKEAKP